MSHVNTGGILAGHTVPSDPLLGSSLRRAGAGYRYQRGGQSFVSANGNALVYLPLPTASDSPDALLLVLESLERTPGLSSLDAAITLYITSGLRASINTQAMQLITALDVPLRIRDDSALFGELWGATVRIPLSIRADVPHTLGLSIAMGASTRDVRGFCSFAYAVPRDRDRRRLDD
jgi:hypothetical protein